VSLRLHQLPWPSADLAARVYDTDAVVCTASLLASGAEVERALDVLSSPERVRFAGFTNEIVARRFAIARRTVREMLGALLQVEPADVPLREGLHGKPYIAAGTPRAVWFSLSHTDDLLVVAISRVADVGVDVERARAFEQWQRVADRVLDAAERRQLERAVEHGEDPGDAFLRHWCRVEAELKAIGCGIAGLEAHLAGARPRGLRLADLEGLPVPAEIAAGGVRYKAAVALCVPVSLSALDDDILRQSTMEMPKVDAPTTSPARASTP
jgi:phosphopantetheinyl transferase